MNAFTTYDIKPSNVDRLDDLRQRFDDLKHQIRSKTRSVSLAHSCAKSQAPTLFDTFSFMNCLMIATDVHASLASSVQQKEAFLKSFLDNVTRSIDLYESHTLRDPFKVVSDRYLNDRAIEHTTRLLNASILVKKMDSTLQVFPCTAAEKDRCIAVKACQTGYELMSCGTLTEVRCAALDGAFMASIAKDTPKSKLVDIANSLGIPIACIQNNKVKMRLKEELSLLIATLPGGPSASVGPPPSSQVARFDGPSPEGR
jgi:hypothetical protein